MKTHFKIWGFAVCGKVSKDTQYVEGSFMQYPIKNFPTCKKCLKFMIDHASLELTGAENERKNCSERLIELDSHVENTKLSLEQARNLCKTA